MLSVGWGGGTFRYERTGTCIKPMHNEVHTLAFYEEVKWEGGKIQRALLSISVGCRGGGGSFQI